MRRILILLAIIGTLFLLLPPTPALAWSSVPFLLLAALFGYQLLLRYNHRGGRSNGQVQWILDTL